MKDHARIRRRSLQGMQGVGLHADEGNLPPVHSQIHKSFRRRSRDVRFDLEGRFRLLGCDHDEPWAKIAARAVAARACGFVKGTGQWWQSLFVAVVQLDEDGVGKAAEKTQRPTMLCSTGCLC